MWFIFRPAYADIFLSFSTFTELIPSHIGTVVQTRVRIHTLRNLPNAGSYSQPDNYLVSSLLQARYFHIFNRERNWRGGIRTHSSSGNRFTVYRDSPTSPPAINLSLCLTSTLVLPTERSLYIRNQTRDLDTSYCFLYLLMRLARVLPQFSNHLPHSVGAWLRHLVIFTNQFYRLKHIWFIDVQKLFFISPNTIK